MATGLRTRIFPVLIGYADATPEEEDRLQGYDVITSDDSKFGRVAGTIGDNLIVEHGHLFKSRNAVPLTFAEADDDAKTVRLTVPKAVVEDAPRVEDGEVDERAVAEHYGLAAAYAAPETEGYGVIEPDDPAFAAETESIRAGIMPGPQQRLQARRHLLDDPARRSRGRQIIPDDPHR